MRKLITTVVMLALTQSSVGWPADDEPSTYWKVIGVTTTEYCLGSEGYMTKKEARDWKTKELADKYDITEGQIKNVLSNEEWSTDAAMLLEKAGGCSQVLKDSYYKFKKP